MNEIGNELYHKHFPEEGDPVSTTLRPCSILVNIDESDRKIRFFNGDSEHYMSDQSVTNFQMDWGDFTDIRVPPAYAVVFSPWVIVIHFVVVLCIRNMYI